MPYFIICPIYALLFIGLMLVALASSFTKQFRRWSSYIALGALGTFPGFILGNVLFWLVAWALLSILQKPVQQITSDVANGMAAVVTVAFFVGGLAVANIGGCVAGFWGGVWIRSRFRRREGG